MVFFFLNQNHCQSVTAWPEVQVQTLYEMTMIITQMWRQYYYCIFLDQLLCIID